MLLEQPLRFTKAIERLLRAPQTRWLGGGRSEINTSIRRERGMDKCGFDVAKASEPLFASAVASGE
eukprot:11095721-Heterocapsa_arctica.AAC.1